jgi:hypothetical protein
MRVDPVLRLKPIGCQQDDLGGAVATAFITRSGLFGLTGSVQGVAFPRMVSAIALQPANEATNSGGPCNI